MLTVDARGAKCIGTTLALTPALFQLAPGDVLEVLGDCETFAQDMREWCQRTQKVLMRVWTEDGIQKAHVRF